MPASAGQVVVSITANSAAYQSEMTKVEAIAKGVGRSVTDSMSKITGVPTTVTQSISKLRAETGEAKASMALLGEEIGVKIPRHIRGFIAEIPGVAPALSAAFSGLAVIGIINVLVEAGKKVYEFQKALGELSDAEKKQHTDAVSNAKESLRLQESLIKGEYELAKAKAKSPEEKKRVQLEEDAALVSINKSYVSKLQAIRNDAVTGYNENKGQAESLRGGFGIPVGGSIIAPDAVTGLLGKGLTKLVSKFLAEKSEERAGAFGNQADETTDLISEGVANQHGAEGRLLNDNAKVIKIDAFATKLQQLKDQVAEARGVLNGIGDDGKEDPLAKAAGKAQQDIDQLNRQNHDEHKGRLTENQKAQIKSQEATLAQLGADKQYQQSVGGVVLGLRTRTENQKALNAAIGQGVDAQRQAYVQEQLDAAQRAIKEKGKTVSPEDAARIKQTAALAFNAALEGSSLTAIKKLDEEGRAVQRVTDARLLGAAAVRQAELQNRLDAATDRGATPDELEKIRQDAAGQHASEVLGAIAERRQGNANQVAFLKEQLALLQQSKGAEEEIVEVEAQLKELRLQDLAQNNRALLQVGGVRDGFKVFFSEMNSNTKSAAQQVNDVLGKAFSGLNDTLTRIISGQKASWADLFRSLAADLAKLGLEKLETSLFSSLGGLFGQGGGGFLSSLFGIGHRAMGGGVDAGNTYLVGERGPELLTMGGSGYVTPNNRISGGGSGDIHYHITGANPVETENAIRRANMATAQYSVRASEQSRQDRMRRVPLSQAR